MSLAIYVYWLINEASSNEKLSLQSHQWILILRKILRKGNLINDSSSIVAADKHKWLWSQCGTSCGVQKDDRLKCKPKPLALHKVVALVNHNQTSVALKQLRHKYGGEKSHKLWSCWCAIKWALSPYLKALSLTCRSW